VRERFEEAMQAPEQTKQEPERERAEGDIEADDDTIEVRYVRAPDGAADDDDLGSFDVGESLYMPTPREWLLSTVFCREFVSSVLAAGGVGKTALRYAQLLSLV